MNTSKEARWFIVGSHIAATSYWTCISFESFWRHSDYAWRDHDVHRSDDIDIYIAWLTNSVCPFIWDSSIFNLNKKGGIISQRWQEWEGSRHKTVPPYTFWPDYIQLQHNGISSGNYALSGVKPLSPVITRMTYGPYAVTERYLWEHPGGQDLHTNTSASSKIHNQRWLSLHHKHT